VNKVVALWLLFDGRIFNHNNENTLATSRSYSHDCIMNSIVILKFWMIYADLTFGLQEIVITHSLFVSLYLKPHECFPFFSIFCFSQEVMVESLAMNCASHFKSTYITHGICMMTSLVMKMTT
jgi:hypothetical protein